MAPRNRNFGFYPAAGTDYTSGVEPTIAARLDKLGKALRLHLVGISGYRSPAHSVAVGGFADDPHTQGRASDTPGIERIPERTLERFGLTRPFPGAAEADHIQLFGARGGSAAPARKGRSYTLGELWIQAGGARNLAPTMAAIALAESGGNEGATGGPNDNGTYDYGLWQINSSHSQFNRARLLSDPLYNARAAVSIYRSQGLTAWSTYNNGAYKSHLGQSSGAMPTFGRTRPGGATQQDAGGPEAVFASYTEDASWHWNPLSPVPFPVPFKVPFSIGPDLGNPLNVFKDASGAIKDTGDFLKWIAWLFHPKNVLRAVEFLTGLTIMGFGLHTMIAVYKDQPEQSATRRGGQAVRRAAGEAFSMTAPGRAVRVSRATRYGKRRARAHNREVEGEKAAKRGRAKEVRKIARRNDRRDKRRAKLPSREKVPF